MREVQAILVALAALRECIPLGAGVSRNVHLRESLKHKEVGYVEKWECMVCGYVYDPAEGDPDSDIPPGTAFEDLPDDWVCPACGAAKDMFEKMA